jgi:CheY-like chemotaxis protein
VAGLENVPIIAMTANAFGEDRQACLAAGMNDHVAKPVNPQTLYETLLRWLPSRATAGVAPSVGARPPAATTGTDLRARLAAIPDLDVARGLELFGGMVPGYLHVLGHFAQIYAGGMPQLDDAMASDDAQGMAAAGHSLRGAGASIGATRVDETAGVLETLGKRGASAAEMAAAAVAAQRALAELVARMRTVFAESAVP